MTDINAKGGVNVGGKKMELELKFVDDKSDPTEGAAAMEKLIKVEGLKLILSTQVTPINLAAATVAEKYQAYYQMSTTLDGLRSGQQNYKWVPDLFFTPGAVAEVPFKMVDTMPQADQPTKWGMLTEDNADGQGLAEASKRQPGNGANLVLYETYHARRQGLLVSHPQAEAGQRRRLVCFVSPADGITFTKQMKEQNFSPKFMMGWKGFWPARVHAGPWAPTPTTSVTTASGLRTCRTRAPKNSAEAYKDEHNGLDSVSIGLFYATVQILAQAIKNAGLHRSCGRQRRRLRRNLQRHHHGRRHLQRRRHRQRASGRPVDGRETRGHCPDQGNKMEWFVPWDQR